MTSSQKKGKHSSRTKINRMVADGTKNYPSYLKLIYTGDSEFSSEDEALPVRRGNTTHRPSLPLLAGQPGQTASSKLCRHKSHKNSCKDIDAPPLKQTPLVSLTQSLTSPESAKLKDEGKEKAATPVNNSSTLPTIHHDLSSNISSSMVGSWHAFNNDKVILDENNHLEKLELERELVQIQDEISSLKNVLDTKVVQASQLKKRLGLGAMSDFKQGLASFKQSETFQKTNAALKSLGGLASKTLTSIKSSRSFFKTPQLNDINHIKQSMSMADMSLAKQSNLECSRSVHNVCLP